LRHKEPGTAISRRTGNKMRRFNPPFRFDLRSLISKAQGALGQHVEGVTISLPFVSIAVRPADQERAAAREIVIRMADRRVLNASECCDGCIDQALSSLQEIRALLVEKQVELASVADGSLYLLVEFMLEAIRQFLTFEQHLNTPSDEPRMVSTPSSSFRRETRNRESYFAALEMLRAHLYRCLAQVSLIADMQIPKITEHMRYDQVWQLEAYEAPVKLD
jgi:hypothetical protein